MTAKRDFAKTPLYRKVITRARHVYHQFGGDYADDRNTKAEARRQGSRGPMSQGVRRGLDYTPLFRFLLSRVGRPWAEVHSEAVSRLDREDPIYLLVARRPDEEARYVNILENTFFSGLKVDEDGLLQVVDPTLRNEELWPFCPCCTHTLNGERFVNAFDQAHSFGIFPNYDDGA